MKRFCIIAVSGLALALLAYGGVLLFNTSKAAVPQRAGAPELAWLQQEFHISNSEMARIETLHHAYVAACAERCRLIDRKNAELQQMLQQATSVTPEIDRCLREAANLRADCQQSMLQHFYQISATMPPDQGKRYFDWVVGRTFGSEHAAMMSAPAAAPHEHHHQ
jgi:hypothetical protein